MTGSKLFSSVAILIVSFIAGLCSLSCEKTVEEVTEILFTNVNSGKISLFTGEEFKVKYMVMPEHLQETAEIEWESSDRKVAVVRRGVIEAKGPSEATITASCGKAKASVIVEVKAIQVVGLDFPIDPIEVYLGATVEVTFENVTPADASLTTVDWKVEDYGHGDATVEAGDECIYITGTEAGVAELFGYIDGEQIGHQEIEIKERIPVTSVSVSLSKQRVTFGESLTISTTVLPSNASIKDVTVTCSPASLVTISGNTIIAGQQAGTVTVTATADGVSGTAEFEIVPPPLELGVTGDFGGNRFNDCYRVLCPDASIATYPKTAQLSLTANYDVDLSGAEWTSSNPAVATVDKNGLVTAVGHGWTDISAKVTTVHGEGTGTLRVRSVKGGSLAFETVREVINGLDYHKVVTADMSTPNYLDFRFQIVETTFKNDIAETWSMTSFLWFESGLSFSVSSSDPALIVSVSTIEPYIVWLKASSPLKQPAKITLTSNFGQSLTVNSRISIGSISIVGYKTGKVYATVLNGGKTNVTIPTGTSAESLLAFINVGDSYDPVTSMRINDGPYDGGWTATKDGKQASLPFDGSRLLSTSSKEYVVSTTALGGFSFTISSQYK